MIARSPPRRASRRKSEPPAADRLTSALKELVGSNSEARSRRAPTVAALCRIAGVSRNSLYRYHAKILQVLREHQEKEKSYRGSSSRSRAVQLRSENLVLRKQIDSVIALVDHYYGAYRETVTLLERRDRELAELRRSLNARPTLIAR